MTDRTAAAASPADASRLTRYGIAVVVVAIALTWDWLTGGIGPQLIFGTTEVTILTSPAGADVLIDGQSVGPTPIDGVEVLAGDRVIRLDHPFHEPVVRRLDAKRDEPATIDVTFEPVIATLLIASNPKNATVTIDGAPQERQTPFEIETHTGRHEIHFELDGREPLSVDVDVLPGEANAVRAELERLPLGILLIDLEPADANVRIGGASYARGMRLVQGPYDLVVSAPGFLTARQSIDVVAGRNQHAFSLRSAISRLTITTVPADAEVVIRLPGEATIPYDGPLSVPFGIVDVTIRAKDHRTYRASWLIDDTERSRRVTLHRQTARVGERIRDRLSRGGNGPELVVLAAGAFDYGSDIGPPDEGPVIRVNLYEAFAIGTHEISRDEYQRFRTETEGGEEPMTGVEWSDAVAYTDWLSAETGERYRLPSEVEWEYAARGGTTTPLYDVFDGARLDGLCRYENVRDQSMREYASGDAVLCNDGYEELAPVGQFEPNPWGLYDVMGNAAEWVADCWRERHRPPRLSAGPLPETSCQTRTVRGGSWLTPSQDLRVTLRVPGGTGRVRRGFRVVRDL